MSLLGCVCPVETLRVRPREGSSNATPVSCSTTHWKQVLFMMDEPVPVHAGDVLTGSIVLQRNPVWRRHMSVALSWSVTSRQDPTVQRVSYSAVKAYVVVLGGGWAGGDHHGGHSLPWPDATATPCPHHFLILMMGSGCCYFQNRKRRCRKVSGLFYDTASQ